MSYHWALSGYFFHVPQNSDDRDPGFNKLLTTIFFFSLICWFFRFTVESNHSYLALFLFFSPFYLRFCSPHPHLKTSDPRWVGESNLDLSWVQQAWWREPHDWLWRLWRLVPLVSAPHVVLAVLGEEALRSRSATLGFLGCLAFHCYPKNRVQGKVSENVININFKNQESLDYCYSA